MVPVAAAVRSVARTSAIRNAVNRRLSSHPNAFSSPFGRPVRAPLASRILRSPAEMSACAISMQPYHTATASALMTSMLTVSRCGFGWFIEATTDDV